MRFPLVALAAIAATMPVAAIAAPTVAPISNFDGTFGSFAGIANGPFDNIWTFTVTEEGFVSGSITATIVGTLPGLTFSSISLNGEELLDTSSGDGTKSFSLTNIFTDATINELRIVGSGRGSYGGSVAFQNLEDSGNPQPAVPEPATWAMMMVGFGLVGYAMRRRTVTFNSQAA